MTPGATTAADPHGDAHYADDTTGSGAPTDLPHRAARVAHVAEQHLARNDRDAQFPAESLTEMRRTGLLGLVVPTAFGGLNGSVRDVVETAITLGRTDLSVAMIFAMHCQQASAIVQYGQEPLRSELLPRIAAGETYLASVTTEAGTGGHLLSAHAQLQDHDARLHIDRFAPVVTGGAHADGFLLTLQSPAATAPHQISLVYAHRDQLEINESGDWQPLGMRASHSIPLKLTGTIPAHQVIGEHGKFHQIAGNVFGPMAHLGWSAAWLGTAAGALSRVLSLLRTPAGRDRFDVRSELLLTRLGRARQRLDGVHALLHHTLAMIEAPEAKMDATSNQLLLNALKLNASEQCHAAVEDLIDAVGLRHGYLKDSPTRLEMALRDLRSAALNYSNDRLRLADGRLALRDQGVRFA